MGFFLLLLLGVGAAALLGLDIFAVLQDFITPV